MTLCKACGAEIDFITLKSGRKTPVDLPALPDSVNDFYNETLIKVWPDGVGDVVRLCNSNLDEYCTYYRTHFATCPHADEMRSRPKSKTAQRIRAKAEEQRRQQWER